MPERLAAQDDPIGLAHSAGEMGGHVGHGAHQVERVDEGAETFDVVLPIEIAVALGFV